MARNWKLKNSCKRHQFFGEEEKTIIYLNFHSDYQHVEKIYRNIFFKYISSQVEYMYQKYSNG